MLAVLQSSIVAKTYWQIVLLICETNVRCDWGKDYIRLQKKLDVRQVTSAVKTAKRTDTDFSAVLSLCFIT